MSKLFKGKINLGDKNGMKQPEARKKVSDARKKMFEDPELRKEYSEKTKKAWEDGKFEGVAVGRCKWYPYTMKDGSIVKCQGTWELAFVTWANENDIELIVHKGRIPYKDDDGVSRNYYPDFFVPAWDKYADVKSDYYWELQKEKFGYIMKSNPNLNLVILKKEDLIKLGVKI